MPHESFMKNFWQGENHPIDIELSDVLEVTMENSTFYILLCFFFAIVFDDV
jgi:hypothetical protein